MHVDPKYHRHFVAKRGELLHEISDQNGGVTVSFPRSGVDSDRVVLKGNLIHTSTALYIIHYILFCTLLRCCAIDPFFVKYAFLRLKFRSLSLVLR